jgi:hypothetical protein
LFPDQTPEALADAVRRFEGAAGRFEPAAIRAHAEHFRGERFRSEMRAEIERALRRDDPEGSRAS